MAYAVANANIFAYLWYGCQGSSTDPKCDLFTVYVLASQIKLLQTLLTREIAIYRWTGIMPKMIEIKVRHYLNHLWKKNRLLSWCTRDKT